MSRTVLLVDRDAPSAKLARLVLEAEGWTVIHVPSSDGACALLAAIRPDVIVTELIMPRSFDPVADMRAVAGDTPIVAVTVMTGPDAAMLSAGCAAVLAKPIDVSTFAAAIAACVGGVNDQGATRR